jgi:ankyrin repeat protein
VAALLADAAAATAAASAAASAASATPTVPLHGAASSQRALRTSIVKLLCAAPGAAAALALRDNHGNTPLALAISLRRAECETLLRTRGATA